MEWFWNEFLHFAGRRVCKDCFTPPFQTQQLFKFCTTVEHVRVARFVGGNRRYGFHKVNKTPRGYKVAQENQVWEFSHTKFIRHRPDLLDEIKRRQGDVDFIREGDLATHMGLMQVQQNDIMKQVITPTRAHTDTLALCVARTSRRAGKRSE